MYQIYIQIVHIVYQFVSVRRYMKELLALKRHGVEEVRSTEIHQHPYAECKSPTNQKHTQNSVETSESGGF